MRRRGGNPYDVGIGVAGVFDEGTASAAATAAIRNASAVAS